ncbi:hypothetical protein ACWCPI_07720 [Streptomyces sp. NPDC001920]
MERRLRTCPATAVTDGLLALAVIPASLRPALLVVPGFVLLHTPLTGRRAAGLGGAAVATGLPTLGRWAGIGHPQVAE